MLRKLRDMGQRLFLRRHLYRECFATEAGQFVLRDMFRTCGVGREQFVAGSADATAYQLGLRRFALRVAKQLNMSDDEIMRLANQAEEETHEQD